MTHHLTKLSALTLCLLSALPVAATPNESRELQLETEERLEQLSESLRPRERNLFDHGWTGNDSFYGNSYGGTIFFHRNINIHGGRGIGIDLDGFTIFVPIRPRHYDHYNDRPRLHNHCSHGTGYQGCHHH
jgi:hypothetical protein